MRVVLINPPQVFNKTQVTAGVVPPLGVLYLSAYLKAHGIEVSVIDAVGEKHDQYATHAGTTLRGLTQAEIIARLPEKADLIGVSLMYSASYLPAQALIAALRAAQPNATIVVGGAHATSLPEYTLAGTEADCAVIGEGEQPLLGLCLNLRHPEAVPGLAYKRDGSIRFSAQQELIANLDDLPFPDWAAIDLRRYFQAAEPHGCSYSRRWAPLIAGRGCPYDCTFCTTPSIWRRRWRVRSVTNVLAEIALLHDSYGVTDFHFEDENLGVKPEWLHEFCDALLAKKLSVTWQPSNGMRAESLVAPGLMAKMKRSGCSLVVFTLESASERVRNQIMRKHLDIAKVEEAMSLARREGLRSTCYFLLGLPGETLDEARQTVRYVHRLARRGLDECVVSLFSLLPGSEQFDALQRAGRVTLDPRFFEDLLSIGDLSRFKSWTEHISSRELRRLRAEAYLGFALIRAVFFPAKALRSAWNIVIGRDQLKSERVLRTFLKRALPSFRTAGRATYGTRQGER